MFVKLRNLLLYNINLIHLYHLEFSSVSTYVVKILGNADEPNYVLNFDDKKIKISQVSVQLAKSSEIVSHKEKCRIKHCEMQYVCS